MIDKILEFSLRQRVFVLLGTLVLIGTGIWSAMHLPIDAVPDITNVQVQINTSVTALAPDEIEKLVTYPIEVEMGGIEKLLEVRSISKFGLSQITLIFEEGTDIYRARQLVGERLQSVLEELPPGITPKLAPISTGLGEIYHYTVRYKSDCKEAPSDPIERLRQLKLAQDYIVKPALRTVAGVTEVNSCGGYEKQFVVQPDPAKLARVGLTVSEVADVIAENVANAGGGVVEKGGESITVRSIGRVQNAEEIADLPLKFAAKPMALRVRDVADIVISSGVRTGTATYNGEEAVLGSTLMLMGENSRLVSQRTHEKIEELERKMPPGMTIETLYNRTDLVNATIHTVGKNLFEGAVLVMVVLLVVLGNLRAALIVASAIPLSMLFMMTGMVHYHIAGNLMSLGAIDFGLIVDGAVVIAENIVRMLGHRQQQLGRLLTKEERLHTILAACKQVGTPTVFGVAIITIVYLPILSLTGVEGKMFKPMAITVIFALVGALILALTVVPVLCSFFLSKKVSEKDSWLISHAKQVYTFLLHGALHFRVWMIVGAIALFVFSIGIFLRLGSEFVPQLDEGTIVLQPIRTTSIGLKASLEMQKETEKLLLEKFPEISRIFTRIGSSEVATDPMGVNIGDTYLTPKLSTEWRKVDGKTISKDELISLMGKELAMRFPGQAHLFSQPIELRFNELLSGARADLAIKIFGDDYDTLEKTANEVREIVEKIPGAAEVEFDAVGKSPVLQIVMNRSAMSKYNVHADEVNKVVETAFAGREAGVIADGNKRYPIVTRLKDSDRTDFAAIAHLSVRTSDGGFISLGQVADIGTTESVNTISREAFQRRMAIMVNLRGRDVQSFVTEAQQQLAQKVKIPAGYFVEFGGAFKNLKEAQSRLAIVVPTALAMIFLLIFMAFGSIRQALIVYSGIPLATTGGVFALWICGIPFSITAGVGFIALSGMAVLNGVVMISYFNQLREEGKTVRDAILEGSLTRLRPILMTALVASLGLLPMALATGAGAEVQRPLAVVVIGGLLTSTLLTLLLLPIIYDWMEKRR